MTAPKTLKDAQDRAHLERSKAFFALARALRTWLAGTPKSSAKPITL